MSFQIIRNDITRVKADAIVNTANPQPVIGGGTDSAIYKAAGEKALLAEREKIGDIPRGQVFATPAFKLQAKYVFHTVGPVWDGGEQGEFEILKNCYENCLKLAVELKCESIAFPLIATGVYGFPKDKALQTAMTAIQAFLMEHEMTVILVVFDKKAFQLSGQVVDNVREYVDSNYVEEARKQEYILDSALEDEEYSTVRVRSNRLCKAAEPVFASFCMESMPAPRKKVKIDDLVAASDKSFQEKLFEIIYDRKLTGPQVYTNYISRQVYSKIQGDRDYHPNKGTAIALCLSLHLSLDETQDLIGRAGWTLSTSQKADLVVRGCILNKEYNLVQVNCILFEYDCPILEKIK